MSDPATTDYILFKIYDASPELHRIGRKEFVNRIGAYTEREQNKHHKQFHLLPIESITLVLSDIEDAILGQHLEVPIAAMPLLRANFLPRGSELLDDTPVTTSILRQYFGTRHPTLAKQAAEIREKLVNKAGLGTLGEIRNADDESTWACVEPAATKGALWTLFKKQASNVNNQNDSSSSNDVNPEPFPHPNKLSKFISPAGNLNTSFAQIRELGFWFVDKSGYLRLFEEVGFPTFVAFRRPQRFGKSLFLQMVKLYYDINTTPEDFRRYFSNLEIGNNPPKHRHLMLVIDFTLVRKGTFDQPLVSDTFTSAFNKFRSDYKKLLGDIANDDNPVRMLLNIVDRVRAIGQTIFLLVDELDLGTSWYLEDLVNPHQPGYNLAKSQLALAKAVLGLAKADQTRDVLVRGYGTGISTLSAFLLSDGQWADISGEQQYSVMVGITSKELQECIDAFSEPSEPQWTGEGPPNKKQKALTPADWVQEVAKTQNGYSFGPNFPPVMNSKVTCLIIAAAIKRGFNADVVDVSDVLPTFVLKLIKKRPETCQLLHDVLYASTPIKAPNQMNKAILDTADLTKRDSFVRFLFSVGFLAFQGDDLVIPNEAARSVMSVEVLTDVLGDFFAESQASVTHFCQGDIGIFVNFIESTGLACFCSRSNRGLTEPAFSAFLIPYISSTSAYVVEPERSVHAGYVDVYAELTASARASHNMFYDYALENKSLMLCELWLRNGKHPTGAMLTGGTPPTQEWLKKNIFVNRTIVERQRQKYSLENRSLDASDKEALLCASLLEVCTKIEREGEEEQMDIDAVAEVEEVAVDNSRATLEEFLQVISAQAVYYDQRLRKRAVQALRLKTLILINLGWSRIVYHEVDRDVAAQLSQTSPTAKKGTSNTSNSNTTSTSAVTTQIDTLFPNSRIDGYDIPLAGNARRSEESRLVYTKVLFNVCKRTDEADLIVEAYKEEKNRFGFELDVQIQTKRVLDGVRNYKNLLDMQVPKWKQIPSFTQ